jgi:hypothetical protein
MDSDRQGCSTESEKSMSHCRGFGVSRAACIALATKLWTAAVDTGAVERRVSNVAKLSLTKRARELMLKNNPEVTSLAVQSASAVNADFGYHTDITAAMPEIIR